MKIIHENKITNFNFVKLVVLLMAVSDVPNSSCALNKIIALCLKQI